ncbi:hypothetical protein CHUAL_011987 [Chamberlinius hualienensis]
MVPDQLKESHHQIQKTKERNKKLYDQKRRVTPDLVVGQEIHIKNHPQSSKAHAFTAKLAPRLRGPYYIQQKVSPFTYVIADRNGTTIGRYHVSDIYPTKNNHVKEGAKISSLFNEEPKPPEDVQESPPPQDIEEPKEDQSITKKTRCGRKIFMPVRFKQ